MTIEYVSIALLCTIIGGVIGILTFSRAKSKDDKGRAQKCACSVRKERRK